MANKDVKSTNGGGLVPVTTLPEKGKVGTLYKTPDGSVYYWFHEEIKKEVEVPDIKVGDALNLVPIIDSATFCDMMDNILKVEPMIHLTNKTVNFTLSESIGEEGVILQDITIECGYSAGTEDPANYRHFRFGNFGERESYIYYPWTDVSYAPTGKEVKREMWNLENATIIVTQELIDKLAENDIAIEDIAPLFENVPTKIIIVTNTNEGYIKVGGLFVLDSKNIAGDWIYNDTYYNAKTIINNALKGVVFGLKEEDSSNQSVHFSKMTSFTYGKAPEGFYGVSIINFGERTIGVVDTNFYGPETITGAELKEQMRIIKGEWGLDFRGDGLMAFIEDSGQVSQEEAQKLMASGTIISLFDGLITLDYILSTGEEGDHIDYELYFNSPTEPMSEQFGYFEGDPCLGNVYCSWSSISVGVDWSNIEDSKEYSTDIIIKFADSTTKAIKTTKDYISTIFSPNIPN